MHPDHVLFALFYNQLSAGSQAGFEGIPPIEAKNMGKIKAWKHHGPAVVAA